MTTPADRNVLQKEVEEKLKYKSLYIYIDTMNVEHEMYSYTSNNWSHRISSKRPAEMLGSHTSRHSTDSLHKTAILGTPLVIRKVLQSET